MVTTGIILTLTAVLVIYLLLTPILISVDTDRMKFQLKMVGILMVWPEFSETLWIHIKIPFKHFQVDLLKRSEKVKKSARKDSSSVKESKKPLSVDIERIKRVISSFKLSHFYLDLDTDNYRLNGQLFPVFWWLNKKGLNCNINFAGNNCLSFELRNNLLRAGLAIIRSR